MPVGCRGIGLIYSTIVEESGRLGGVQKVQMLITKLSPLPMHFKDCNIIRSARRPMKPQ